MSWLRNISSSQFKQFDNKQKTKKMKSRLKSEDVGDEMHRIRREKCKKVLYYNYFRKVLNNQDQTRWPEPHLKFCHIMVRITSSIVRATFLSSTKQRNKRLQQLKFLNIKACKKYRYYINIKYYSRERVGCYWTLN